MVDGRPGEPQRPRSAWSSIRIGSFMFVVLIIDPINSVILIFVVLKVVIFVVLKVVKKFSWH